MKSDTSEKGLEEIIENVLLHSGYEKRESQDFNVEYAIDEGMLRIFLENTQRDKVQRSRIFDSEVNTRKFYERLRNQITQRGIVDVLRHGMEHNATKFDLYYPTPKCQPPGKDIVSEQPFRLRAPATLLHAASGSKYRHRVDDQWSACYHDGT